MGVVYQGFDPAIGRTVAIKTLHRNLIDEAGGDDALARFQREAQSAGRLNHPGIVTIYDYGDEDGIAYLVMEYVKGRSIRDVFESDEGFPIDQVPGVMTAILEALEYAHDNGIVHRDIKPANIMLLDGEKLAVKIMDFGIARIESSNLTQVGTAIGTPGYMSPEQFTGGEIDARTDLFSAGVLLYQFLTGEKPFVGSVTVTMHKVLKETPIDPSDLNLHCTPEIDALVHKAIAKRPSDRYQTAGEFITDIERAFAMAATDPGEDKTRVLDRNAAGEGTVVLRRADPAENQPRQPRGPSKADTPEAPPVADPSTVAKPSSPMPKIAAAALAATVVIGGVAWSFFSDEPPPPVTKAAPQNRPAVATESPPQKATASLGTVEVVTSPPGASVRKQDGVVLGVSPLDVTLPAGEYELVLSKEGFHDVSASIEVEAGDRIPFEVEMTAK